MIKPEEIKAARHAAGMTQIEVARAVGISAPGYRLWEYGGSQPTEDNEKKLREVLGIGGSHDASKQDTAAAD